MITLEGLNLSLGGRRVLQDLDLHVSPGELFGVVGADGAGKTSLLRVLAGVLPYSARTATVAGTDLNDDSVRSHVAYMPQKFGLYQDLTVEENINFYAQLFLVEAGELASRKKRLYEFSGLGEFRTRLAGNLSGGMKQKLGLSCALIHRPKLLLLDEPTFGVDPISRRDLWIIIHEMVAEGVTALVSTSYMDEAERFDRLLMLEEGSVVVLGTPISIRSAISDRTYAVRSTEREVRRTREVLLSHPDVETAYVFGDRVHAIAASGVDSLSLEGFDVTRIDASLEDVFMSRASDV